MRLKIGLDSFKKDMDSAIMDQHHVLAEWTRNKEENELKWRIYEIGYLWQTGSGAEDINLVFHYQEDKDWKVDIIEITDNGRLKEMLTDVKVKIDKIPDSPAKDDVQLLEAYKSLQSAWGEAFYVKQFLLHLVQTIMYDKEYKWSKPSAKALDELRVKYVKATAKLDELKETFKNTYGIK